MTTVFLILAVILISCMVIYEIWFVLCILIGVTAETEALPEEQPQRFAILTCARNEEASVLDLLESIRHLQYPADRIKVFVVAHNCTDRTAEAASRMGAEVIVRNDPGDTGKGDALRFAVTYLAGHYPSAFDAVAFFDADNLLDPQCIGQMNAALRRGAHIVTGFRDSQNRHENRISEICSSFWYMAAYFQQLPCRKLGLPVPITGTGFAVRYDILTKGGWDTVTLVEDAEFFIQKTLEGCRSEYIPGAVFYDQQPTTLSDMIRQRFRWIVNGGDLIYRYAGRVFREIFRGRLRLLSLIPHTMFHLILLPQYLCSVFLIAADLTGYADLTTLLHMRMLFDAVTFLIYEAGLILLLVRAGHPLKENLSTVFLGWIPMLLSFVFVPIALILRKSRWTAIPHKSYGSTIGKEK